MIFQKITDPDLNLFDILLALDSFGFNICCKL